MLAESKQSTSNTRPRRKRARSGQAAVDLTAWHAALAKAKLPPAVKATGLLLGALLSPTGETETTLKRLAKALDRPRRTLARQLPKLEGVGFIQVVQHHDPKTGWHTDSTYRIKLPVVVDDALATEVESTAQPPSQPTPRCMREGAKSGTETSVPRVAQHLPIHWVIPLNGTPTGKEEVVAPHAVLPEAPSDAPELTPIRTPNWGRDLLAAKARLMVRPPDLDDDDVDNGGEAPLAFVSLDTGGLEPDFRYAAGGAA